MKRTLSHQCPECFRKSYFRFLLPILTTRGFAVILAEAADWSLDNRMHEVDHANECIQLILEDERLEGGFLHDEAKRESYTENE